MPDVMTEVHEFDARAAEYVLGTLDTGERLEARALLGSDEKFAVLVKEWERRLGELHLMVEPVEPAGQVWERVKAKIGGFEFTARFEAPVPPAPPLPPMPEPEPPISASAQPAAAEPALPQPVERTPESAPAAPPLVLAASREPAPAAAAVAMAMAGDAARWRRSLHQWRALALLMTVVALVLAGFVAALRNFPDRLPPAVRLQFQTTAAVPPGALPSARPRAPAQSQFDE